jgi:L-aspartate oxidase
MITTNYLIIGSGVAGLTFAIKIADRFPDKKVTLITKAAADESNTKYAQGGIAVVLDQDDDTYQKHIQDTLVCGDGLCDEEVVKMVITEGPKRVKELIEWGAKFDKNTTGNFDLGKEGGHSQNRVVHHKDQTGSEVERTILAEAHKKKNIQVLDHHFALDLITENGGCYGAYAFNQKTNEILTYRSEYTLLATGGIGHLYGHTTNPVIATGDGIAMAHRVNAVTQDMEFIQFHPTALYETSSGPKFLISEAVRGFGAHLRTKAGVRFMLNYDNRGELASRDIVSQSIDIELKKTGEACVFLDCTHLNLIEFKKHFPTIYERCLSIGIDIAKDWIPVIPAQHYLCGGIKVDQNGKTSIENLFACGECSQTGLHGANRLASNSLLEALVYSDKIYHYLANTTSESLKPIHAVTDYKEPQKTPVDLALITKMTEALQDLMHHNVGIVRNETDLLKALEQLTAWQYEIELIDRNFQINTAVCELNNMITIGMLIVEQSIERKENCGSFMKNNSFEIEEFTN